jgi:F-box/leucine-rich repeat protein 2/20
MYLMNVSYFIRYCIIFSSYKFYRASNLRSIQLDSCIRISDEGLCEVAKKFPLLEEISISYGFQSKKSLEVIGLSCTLLKSLKLNRFGGCIMCDDEALIIAKSMSGLRHLDIRGNPLSDVGLIAILDGCPLLESLDIRGCNNLDFSGNLWKRLHNQIKDLKVREHFNNFELEFAYSDSNGNSYWEIVEKFSDEDEAEDDDEDYGA